MLTSIDVSFLPYKLSINSVISLQRAKYFLRNLSQRELRKCDQFHDLLQPSSPMWCSSLCEQ